jgi:hypothetical protein
MRSNIPCTFDRRHEPTFKLTCICSSVEPHLTHTLLYVCDRTYPLRSNAYTGLHSNSLAFVRAQSPLHTHTQHECDRTHIHTFDRMRSKPSRDLFLGHFPLFPFHFSCVVQFSPTSFLLSSTKHTVPLPPIISHHHCAITAPPPRRHNAFASPISPPFPYLYSSSPKPTNPQTPICFLLLFINKGHKSIHGLCPLFVGLVLLVFAEGWVEFCGASQTLVLKVAHQVFGKIP